MGYSAVPIRTSARACLQTTVDVGRTRLLQRGCSHPGPVSRLGQFCSSINNLFIARSIYEQTYDRVIAADASSLGVGFNEARHWHRRVYGGLVRSFARALCICSNTIVA
jgi:hypothetical protein